MHAYIRTTYIHTTYIMHLPIHPHIYEFIHTSTHPCAFQEAFAAWRNTPVSQRTRVMLEYATRIRDNMVFSYI